MSKYDVVVFDLDGTLLDTSEGVLSSVKYAIDYFNFDKVNEEKLSTFIGPPIQVSFINHFGISAEKAQEVATIFRNHYKDEDLFKAVPYEGIFDALANLKNKGIKLAVATYKRQDYAYGILEHFGFTDYMDIIYGSDHENKLKKKDIIELAIKDSNASDKSKVVMVGDSDNDAIGAREIGVDFIGVTYGFGFKNKSDIAAFDNVGAADNMKELEELILA